MLKLKEDWCGITQEGLLKKVNIQHGLNIINSIIWENLVCVIWLGASSMNLKEDWCGITQDDQLEKVILHA